MSLLTRDAILAAPDMLTEEVPVPEWGGTVLVRGLTGTERDAFEEEMITGKGKNRDVNLANFRARLIVKSVVDKAGKRLFTQADMVALGGKSAAAIQRVFQVAMRLSGMSEEDVEELTKNSEPGQSDSSTSA